MEVLKYEFMQNAIVAGILLGIITPIIGSFLIVRRLAYLPETIGHINLSGITFGLYLSKVLAVAINPLYIGVIFSIVGTLFIEKIRSMYSNFKEISMVVVLSVSLALALIFSSLANGLNTEIFGYLFGSIISIRRSEVLFLIIITIAFLIFVYINYFNLINLSFNDDQNKKNKVLNLIFISMASGIIGIAIKLTGALIVSALVVIPIASAMKISNSFKGTIIIGIIINEFIILFGLVVSYLLDIPTGATIVLLGTVVFILCIIYERLKAKRNEKNISSI